MQAENIILDRIHVVLEELEKEIYTPLQELSCSYLFSADSAIPMKGLEQQSWKPLSIGESWGKVWGCGWFRFEAELPASLASNLANCEAHLDFEGEGCVYLNGKPYIGLTHQYDNPSFPQMHCKKRVPILADMLRGNRLSILVDASANRLFGDQGKTYILREAGLVRNNPSAERRYLDIRFLRDLAVSLPEDSSRRRKIIRSLNTVANVLHEENSDPLISYLLQSALRGEGGQNRVISVGHSHLDLAWLWPLRETRRKAVRTSATALRMLERYPAYQFGFSQPQMYEWIEADEPELFAEITEQIGKGRWECFGALWVEPDTNISSYESLIRQFVYGKRYWKEKFGIDVRNAWLPDTFGFNPNLPQIMRGCGVENFMTIKLSWNESNAFPYHAFRWEGLDGSRVNAHILPTHDYNFDNSPKNLRSADDRWEAYGMLDSYLNLYGIGDGGGGPSVEHIEYAFRSANCEGLPRLRMAKSTEFFSQLESVSESLPLWRGQLYLELHRGTYTSQSEIKRLHALIELALHDLECILALTKRSGGRKVDGFWKTLLLHEFHDILPGSSITMVYTESSKTLQDLLVDIGKFSRSLLADVSGSTTSDAGKTDPADSTGNSVLYLINTKGISDAGWYEHNGQHFPYSLEAFSAGYFGSEELGKPARSDKATDKATDSQTEDSAKAQQGAMQEFSNGILALKLAEDGSIASLIDLRNGRQMLGEGGLCFAVWEDIPSNWEAWDVTGYYRETEPKPARLQNSEVLFWDSRGIRIELGYEIGTASKLRCTLTLRPNSSRIDIDLWVDWQERRKMLRMAVNTSISNDFVHCGVQGGYVQRSTLSNNKWEKAAFEVPVHRFADISDSQAGLAVLAFAKYGYHFATQLMDINLLRGTTIPDPEADRGEHRIRLGLYCHNSHFINSDVIDKAECFYHRPFALPIASGDSTPMEAEHNNSSTENFEKLAIGSSMKGISGLITQELVDTYDGAGTSVAANSSVKFASQDPSANQHIVVRLIKPAESGEGLVLRIAETGGYPGRLRIGGRLVEQAEKVMLCNYLEDPESEVLVESGTVDITASPFQVQTLLLYGKEHTLRPA